MFSPSPRNAPSPSDVRMCDINDIKWAEYNRWYKLDGEKVKEIKNNLDKEPPVLTVRECDGQTILVKGYHAWRALKETCYAGNVVCKVDTRKETEIILGILKEKLELAMRVKGVANVAEWKALGSKKNYDCVFASQRDRYWLLNRLYVGLKEDGYTHQEAQDYIEEQLCEHHTRFTQKLRCMYYIHPRLVSLIDENNLSFSKLMHVISATIAQQLELLERIRARTDTDITTAYVSEGVNMGIFHKKSPNTNDINHIGVKRDTPTIKVTSRIPDYILKYPLPHDAFFGPEETERAETSGCVDEENDLVPVTINVPKETAEKIGRMAEENESRLIKIICDLIQTWYNLW